MSAHTAKQVRRRAKLVLIPRELRLDGLGDWLRAREDGHRETRRSARNAKKELTAQGDARNDDGAERPGVENPKQ
jgi:hypothetical protein